MKKFTAPKTPEATARRRNVRRTLAAVTGLTLAATTIGPKFADHEIGHEEITVQPGDGYTAVFERAKDIEVAQGNEDIAMSGFESIAEEYQNRLGRSLQPGEKIDVTFKENGFGVESIDAHIVQADENGQ